MISFQLMSDGGYACITFQFWSPSYWVLSSFKRFSFTSSISSRVSATQSFSLKQINAIPKFFFKLFCFIFMISWSVSFKLFSNSFLFWRKRSFCYKFFDFWFFNFFNFFFKFFLFLLSYFIFPIGLYNWTFTIFLCPNLKENTSLIAF